MRGIRCFLAAVTMLFLVNGWAFSQSRYFQFGNLNDHAVVATTTWTKVGTAGTYTFSKAAASTRIEVFVNSRFSVGALAGGANGIRFQIRVDNRTPAFENWGSLRASNSTEFLSMSAVFPTLPTGIHTVSLWVQTIPAGTAAHVTADPGGWGGKIIVKETLW